RLPGSHTPVTNVEISFEAFIRRSKGLLSLIDNTATLFSAARMAFNKLVSLARLLKPALWQWYNHNAFEMAAALAYYTLVSLAPLIIILPAIAGPFFGTAATENYIIEAISGIAGDETANA